MVLSIIVAIYNLGERVLPCLHSILREVNNYNDVEVLLVDDGSTDNTDVLIKKCVDGYASIHYLKKENGGLSDARNYGLRRATGDWVWFIDGDDELAEKGVFTILSVIKNNPNVDLLTFDFAKIHPNKTYQVHNSFPVKKNFGGVKFLEESFPGCTWRNVYNKSFLSQNSLQFLKGAYSEDLEFDFRVFSVAKNIRYINTVIYKYVCNHSIESLSHTTASLEKMTNKFAIIHAAYKGALKTGSYIFGLRAAQIMNMILLGEYPSLNSKEKQRYMEEFDKRKNEIIYLYGNSHSLKYVIPSYVLKINTPLFIVFLRFLSGLMSFLKK